MVGQSMIGQLPPGSISGDWPTASAAALFSAPPETAKGIVELRLGPGRSVRYDKRRILDAAKTLNAAHARPPQSLVLENVGGLVVTCSYETVAALSAPQPDWQALAVAMMRYAGNTAADEASEKFCGDARQRAARQTADAQRDSAVIPDGYVPHGAAQISAFLSAHPGVGTLLARAREPIREYFRPLTTAMLELQTDPELPDLTQLLVRIRPGGDPRGALAQLGRFDTEWWLRQPESRGSLICFLLDA